MAHEYAAAMPNPKKQFFISSNGQICVRVPDGKSYTAKPSDGGLLQAFNPQYVWRATDEETIWWKKQPEFWAYCKFFNFNPTTCLSMGRTVAPPPDPRV